jgi:hypothetical protein
MRARTSSATMTSTTLLRECVRQVQSEIDQHDIVQREIPSAFRSGREFHRLRRGKKEKG